MTTIIYISHDGIRTTVDAKDGISVMDAAVRNDVPGIVGECGGACACSTCHVFVDPAWHDLVGAPSTMEKSMLEFTSNVRETSRLSCQISITPKLDGLIVHTPESQQSAM